MTRLTRSNSDSSKPRNRLESSMMYVGISAQVLDRRVVAACVAF